MENEEKKPTPEGAGSQKEKGVFIDISAFQGAIDPHADTRNLLKGLSAVFESLANLIK